MSRVHRMLVRCAMQDTKNLIVAQQARKVARVIYLLTADYPPPERFGLTSQMRRAAVSVGSNIAEGCGRRGVRELTAFLYIAMGSASELEFQCELALELAFGDAERTTLALAEIQRLKRMLAKLIAALRRKHVRNANEDPA
jgi:four helix bundle protein